MRSIATDQRVPVAISMPGRYKSCRRSPSELFTKEQEQDLQRCAAQAEDCTKTEQQQEKEKEKQEQQEKEQEQQQEQQQQQDSSGEGGLQEKASSPARTIEANPNPNPNPNPPKLTPLRWRSTSMKELNGSPVVAASAQEPAAEEPPKIPPISTIQPPEPMRGVQAGAVRGVQAGKRPSQAQLRAQVMNSLLSQQAVKANDAQAAGEPLNAPSEKEQAPGKEGSVNLVNPVNPVKPVEQKSSGKEESLNPVNPVEQKSSTARTELFPEKKEEEGAVSPVVKDEVVNGPEVRSIPSGNGTKGSHTKPDMPVVPIDEDLPEEVVFEPVDLDQKYREKELVRHVTAAKIQNREEALLNNPGSPAVNGRKGPVGEEPAAMTIEFLRARLQSERSASKTVKLRMESLSKKVVELETRLLAEVELRKSAEVALNDALFKLKQAVPQATPIPTPGATPGAPKAADPEGKDAVKTVQKGDVGSKVESVESNKTVSRDELPSATSIPLSEKKEPLGGNEESAAPTVEGKVVDKGGLWRDRSVQGVEANGGEKETVAKGSPDSSSDSSTERAGSPSKQKQEKRAVIEERLRSMWAKIGEDMAALSEVRGDEEPGARDATRLKAQLPSVLQEKQQSSGDSGGAVNGQQADSSEGDSEQTDGVHNSANGKKKPSAVTNKAASLAEKRNSFKRNASLAKNVAKLVEQYELQETAQRIWEEQQSLEQHEGEPPALVTPDGDVVTEGALGSRAKGGITRSQSQGGERSHQTVQAEPISRSKSMGFLPSQQGLNGSAKISRRGSSNGRIEILDDSLLEESPERDLEELVFDPETEVAEELPNGIYLHHSRAEVDPSYSKRGSPKDAMYRRGTEHVSPRRAAHHSRERFPCKESHEDSIMDRAQQQQQQQGWPVREVQDRASRDMYYDPALNRGGSGSGGGAPYSNSEREFHHRSKAIPEKLPGEMYRNGHWRGEGPGRGPPEGHYPHPHPHSHPTHSHPTSEDPPGMPYGYSHRDHPDQDTPYRAAPSYRQREDGHRGMPSAWQEGGRGMGHPPPYRYPSSGYSVEEPQQPPYVQPGLYGDSAGYRGRDAAPYMSHGTHNPRSDYYSSGGKAGPGFRPSYAPPDRPPGAQGYSGGWDNNGGGVHEDRGAAPVGGVAEDAPPAGGGEAGEVLKALRIAKQQIKSSTGEQAGFMTAQYTVSQEHRYGAGGQVSKTSYTVEAPVGWHLDGGKASGKRKGLNGGNGLNVTELISGAGPLTVAGAESSYVEKLNVGRGIQFFFG